MFMAGMILAENSALLSWQGSLPAASLCKCGESVIRRELRVRSKCC